MTLRPSERLAYRLFGRLATSGAERNAHLRIALQRAHIPLRPEVYLANAYLTAAVVGVLSLLPVLALGILSVAGYAAISRSLFLILLPAPFILAAVVYLLSLILPDMKAMNRARDIQAKLPYALNYISTMASAGATPEVLFGSLAEQTLYGEVARECAWIARDIRLLGADIVGALQRAIDRSPSAKFQDFLQGTVTTLTSGGDLKSYFNGKADQFIYENRQEQRKFLDGLGVLAESFVTVVVAAPLFLIVILSVMTSFGGSAEQTLLIGYVLIFLLIPISQAGFAWTIKVMTPEA
ncbi:MAG: type II secretion system F family protein [Thermoplasmatota archaeon]|nr:type II secretion system F family protein [Halobacteriales archaeon]